MSIGEMFIGKEECYGVMIKVLFILIVNVICKFIDHSHSTHAFQLIDMRLRLSDPLQRSLFFTRTS